MARYEDNSQSIGNTPLIKLNRVAGSEATVLAKVEGRSPGLFGKGSHRRGDDLGRREAGRLKPGMEIISRPPAIRA